MGSPPETPAFNILQGTEGVRTLTAGVHILPAQGNAFAVETDPGVVLVDAGPGGGGTRRMIEALRSLTDAPVRAICYSHGHNGYNSGVPLWLEHAAERKQAPPRLIAHANLVRRYRRYRETRGLQRTLAAIQFPGADAVADVTMQVHDPTETFDERLVLGGPGRRVELLWTPSETDDSISLWLPDEGILYGGAATPGSSIPNVGTPLRTQRFTVRWAESLERMAALGARLLVQEFGPCVEGPEPIERQLLDTARALRWLREQVVERMNRGMSEVEILHDIEYPAELFERPWMQPIYGAPEYIVRDLYREENGWWDRNPTTLHPAHPDAAGEAVLSAIADRGAVLARARSLAEAGEPQLALHVVDLLALAPGDDPDVVAARQLKAELCRSRSKQVAPYVSKACYRSSSDLLERGVRSWKDRG
jgi:uncharacterized sulfatase